MQTGKHFLNYCGKGENWYFYFLQSIRYDFKPMNTPFNNKIVVADICNTLFDSNTTFDFVRYCVVQKKVSFYNRVLYKFFLYRWFPGFWVIVFLEKLSKKDYHKKIVTSLFRNRTVIEVSEWAESFFESYLRSRSISQTNNILKQYKSSKIVLISSTLYPIAEVIAKKTGINDFIATSMEIVGSKYTGKILLEVAGQKKELLRDKFTGDDFTLEMVVTDNLTDFNLMASADRKIAVCYDKQQEKFWKKIPGIEILFIQL